MNEWFLKTAGNYLVKALTEDKIISWSATVKNLLMPIVENKKDELIDYLKVKAKDTNNDLAETAVDDLDKFIDAFFPNKPNHL